jgi:hypothetical protein
MPSFGMLSCVAFARTDVSEEYSCAIIMVAIIGELERSTVTSNRSTVRRNLADSFLPEFGRVGGYIFPKHWFLYETSGVTSQMTAFFIDTAVNPQILNRINWLGPVTVM